jgi:WD40 repeat protein
MPATASSAAPTQFYADSVRIWDVKTCKELRKIAVPNVYCLAWSPDGKRLVTGGAHDHLVRVWDVESGKEVRRYEGHTNTVVAVTFFPGGKRIASGSFDRTARVWRAPR